MSTRRFLIGACIIGAVYAAIVVVLAQLVGKESAGVAAVALTATATALLKQFETSFVVKVLNEPKALNLPLTRPRFNFAFLIVAAFATWGAQRCLRRLFDIYLGLAHPSESVGLITGAQIELLVFVVLQLFVYMATGFLFARVAQWYLYSQTAFAILVALTANWILTLAERNTGSYDMARVTAQLIASLVFVAFALFGAWIGHITRQRQMRMKQTAIKRLSP